MNEVLAIIVVAFFAERLDCSKDFDKMSVEEIGGDTDLLT